MPSRDDPMKRSLSLPADRQFIPAVPHAQGTDDFASFVRQLTPPPRMDEPVPGWAIALMQEQARQSQQIGNVDRKTSQLCSSVHGDGEEKPGLCLDVRELKGNVKALMVDREAVRNLPFRWGGTVIRGILTAAGGLILGMLIHAKPEAPVKIENHSTVEAPHP